MILGKLVRADSTDVAVKAPRSDFSFVSWGLRDIRLLAIARTLYPGVGLTKIRK